MSKSYGTEFSPKSTASFTKPQFVFEINKARIWGGKRDTVDQLDRWSLMIPLLDSYNSFTPENPIGANSEARVFVPSHLFDKKIPPVLSIKWADQSVPYLEKEWWKDLTTFLQGHKGDVVLFCMGGHGRTGTALTILASLAGKVPADACPVAWLRAEYCDKAVESDTQISYIEKITDEPVTSGPSNTYLYGLSHNSWNKDDIPKYMDNSYDGGVREPKTYKTVYSKKERKKMRKKNWYTA